MKHLIAVAAAAASVLVLTGLAQAGGPTPGIAQTGDGIAVAGGARLVARPGAAGTTVVRLVRDGTTLSQRSLAGTLGIPLVTFGGLADGTWQGGRRALLATSPYDDQTRTTFVVLDTRTLEPLRTIRLRGMFAYDAVSSDGRRLFVLHFPKGIDGGIHYVVRSVNLVSGRLEPGAIVDKTEPGERMAGLPMARATSSDRGWVYTLYNGGTSHAFVHALDTKHRTARCIDLPWHGKDQNDLERAPGAAGRHARPQPAAGRCARGDRPPLVRGRRDARARRSRA